MKEKLSEFIANNELLSKIRDFLNAHKNITQLVKFTFLSCIAAIVEVVSLNILLAALKGYSDTPVNWFIFNYGPAEKGLCGFVAFIVSTVLAQIVSFVVNRKKTFNANNNLVFSIVAYIIMEVVVIGLQIWSGPLLTGVIVNAGLKNTDLAANISKFAWMFMSFVVVFVMDKFVIMRNTDKKGKAVSDAEEAIEEVEEAIETVLEEVACSDDTNVAIE